MNSDTRETNQGFSEPAWCSKLTANQIDSLGANQIFSISLPELMLRQPYFQMSQAGFSDEHHSSFGDRCLFLPTFSFQIHLQLHNPGWVLPSFHFLFSWSGIFV